MKLTEELYLENSKSGYFKLVHKGLGKVKGEEILVDKRTREYGTVYQALQAIINEEYDIDKDLLEQFTMLCNLISEKKEEIKKEFRTTVKVSN